jgi:hypothetical protein
MISTYNELEATAIDISYAYMCAEKTKDKMPFLVSQGLMDYIVGRWRKPPVPTKHDRFWIYEMQLVCGIDVILVVLKEDGRNN